MNYKLSPKGITRSCRWIILIAVLSLPFFIIGLLAPGNKIVLATLFILLLLIVPQIFIIMQYISATTYTELEIDYVEQKVIISSKNDQTIKDFAAIQSVQFYKPTVSAYRLSAVLLLCTHLYYYKLEFKEESYYLTSLLSPDLMLDPQGPLYDKMIVVETQYASIK